MTRLWIVLAWLLTVGFAASAEPAPLRYRDGVALLELSTAQVEQLGLTVDVPMPYAQIRETSAVGEVVAASPLLVARAKARGRARALALLGEIATLHRARIDAIEKQQKVGGAADFEGRYQVSVSIADNELAQARLVASQTAAREALSTRWGSALLDYVESHPAVADALASGAQTLVRIGFGTSGALPTEVLAAMDGVRDHAQALTVITAAPITQSGVAQSGWALAPGTMFPSGGTPAVWVSAATAAHGYKVPAAALVWLHGAQWIYDATPAGTGLQQFARRRVDTQPLSPSEVFVEAELPTRIVTAGAQALLAEELRWSIPEEDED